MDGIREEVGAGEEVMTWILVLMLSFWEETYTVTLQFQSMHCEECKTDLTQRLEKVRGVQSVRIGGCSAVADVEERSRFDLGSFRGAKPRDMRLLEVRISLRGRASEAGGHVRITAKSSGQVIDLVNPERQDTVGDLKNQLGGSNKFFIEGVALESTRVELHRFSKTEFEER